MKTVQAGLLIKADGTETEVTPGDRKFTLAELQDMVGGYIQLVSTHDGRQMFVNEEGLLMNLPRNAKASEVIASKWWTLNGVQGDAVVVFPSSLARWKSRVAK